MVTPADRGAEKPDSAARLRTTLASVAPGTELREGLERILRGRTGALVVVGFDNTPDSAMTTPPLTTVDQSIQALGQEAVRLVLQLIDDPDRNDPRDPIHVTLPTQLVIRSTTAPPAS